MGHLSKLLHFNRIMFITNHHNSVGKFFLFYWNDNFTMETHVLTLLFRVFHFVTWAIFYLKNILSWLVVYLLSAILSRSGETKRISREKRNRNCGLGTKENVSKSFSIWWHVNCACVCTCMYACIRSTSNKTPVHRVPLTTSTSIHRDVFVVTGTRCIRTFLTLVSMRTVHFREKNLLVVAGYSL